MSVLDLDPKQARRLLDILNCSLQLSFSVIGEAARHIRPETSAKVGGLPLDKMRGLRNLISHDYHRVDSELLSKIAQESVPLVIAQLEPYERQLYLAGELEFPSA